MNKIFSIFLLSALTLSCIAYAQEQRENESSCIEIKNGKRLLRPCLQDTPEGQLMVLLSNYYDYHMFDEKKLDSLIAQGLDLNFWVDTNAGSYNPLIIAVDLGCPLRVIETLVLAGADPNATFSTAEGVSALMAAIVLKRSDVVDMFLNHGASPLGCTIIHDKNITALGLAVSGEYADRPREAQLKVYRTKEHESELIVHRLLEKGASVSPEDVMAAIKAGNSAIVQTLIEDAHALEHEHTCTLIHALLHGNKNNMLRILLAGGAHPDKTDEHGMTALMHAAQGGMDGEVELLLMYQADPYLKNVEGMTARDLAQKEGHLATVELLQVAEQDFSAHPYLTAAAVMTVAVAAIIAPVAYFMHVVLQEKKAA